MSQSGDITQKERNYLEDAMQMENLCITKCSVYADQCENQALKSFFFEHAQLKRQHANKLKQMLGQQSTAVRQQFH